MTQQAELLKKIDKLPPQYFREVIDFVGYLQHKAQQNKVEQEPLKERESGCVKGDYWMAEDFNAPLEENPNDPFKERRGYGCMKGKVWMAEDFNAPLEDFKDYM